MKSIEPEKVLKTTITLLTLAAVIRTIIRPDQARLGWMKMMRYTEKTCQNNAVVWANLADSSKRAYDAARYVN